MNWLDPKFLIPTIGLGGVLAVLFVECGLFCFFLPGDSLLFTAGLFATNVGVLLHAPQSLPVLLVAFPVTAVAGAQLGHLVGARLGRRLLQRDGRVIRRDHLQRAEAYFEKFGPAKAIVLARFIPIVRTFLNPVAGVLGVSARRFLLWNAVGAILWTEGLTLLGYFLGRTVPGVDQYLLPAVALIVVVSLLPVVIEVVRNRRRTKGRGESRETDSDAA